MSDDADDPYLHPSPVVPVGENAISINAAGDVTMERRPPSEQHKAWKGAKKTAAVDDEMILRIGERPSGIVDYRIGKSVTVSWRGGRQTDDRRWLCHTCVVNKCQHTQRVDRFRREIEGEST